MHEMGLVRDLLRQAESAASGGVTSIHLRVGALSGVSPQYLREYIDREALARWGHRPRVEIDVSDDVASPDALGVLLVSVGA